MSGHRVTATRARVFKLGECLAAGQRELGDAHAARHVVGAAPRARRHLRRPGRHQEAAERLHRRPAWPAAALRHREIDAASVRSQRERARLRRAAARRHPVHLWGVQNNTGTLRSSHSDRRHCGLRRPPVGPARTTGGVGNPDAEGVTIADADRPAAGSTSRRSATAQRRGQPARGSCATTRPAGGALISATNEWNLAADLPGLGANLGLEAIAWVPDTLPDLEGAQRPGRRRDVQPGQLLEPRQRDCSSSASSRPVR